MDVVRVIDGDTIEVLYPTGEVEKVRLIGVDTPETKHPTKGVEPFGPEASAYTTMRLGGAAVSLEFDVEYRDRYGRVLAYVWVGEELFNLTLLQAGLAMVSTFPPNVKYVDDFVAAQHGAQQQQVGIWEGWAPPPCININTATFEELQGIVHIGPVRARDLIKKRPYSSLTGMLRIDGISANRLEEIRDEGLACV